MGSRIEAMIPQSLSKQRRPRITDERHLAFVRLLPCVICGKGPVDPCHLRAGNLLLGKRHVGIAEKPNDAPWTTPLCRRHHDEQHQASEIAFWESYRINPWQLALALYAASAAHDLETAEKIVAEHRHLALGWTETQ